MTRDDKVILKALLLTAVCYAGIIIAGTAVIFGVLYIIGWVAELLASRIPFWIIWAIFFTVCFGALFGAISSSPGASEQKK